MTAAGSPLATAEAADRADLDVAEISRALAEGSYRLVAFLPPEGVYKKFLYVVQPAADPPAEIFLPFYVEDRARWRALT